MDEVTREIGRQIVALNEIIQKFSPRKLNPQEINEIIERWGNYLILSHFKIIFYKELDRSTGRASQQLAQNSYTQNGNFQQLSSILSKLLYLSLKTSFAALLTPSLLKISSQRNESIVKITTMCSSNPVRKQYGGEILNPPPPNYSLGGFLS